VTVSLLLLLASAPLDHRLYGQAEQPLTGIVEFYDEHGTKVPATVTQVGVESATAPLSQNVDNFPYSLKPGEVRRFILTANGPKISAMAIVRPSVGTPLYFAHTPFGGGFSTELELVGQKDGATGTSTLKLNYADGTRKTMAATAPAGTVTSPLRNSTRLGFAADFSDAKAAKRTALAVANPHETGINVLLSAYDMDGKEFGHVLYNVPPFASVIGWADVLFPNAPQYKYGSIQINASGTTAPIGFSIDGGILTLTTVEDGTMPTSAPSYTLKDLFNRGTLRNSDDLSKLPPIVLSTGAKVILDGAGHYELTINKDGIVQFSGSVVDGDYTRTISVPGYVTEKQKVHFPDTPETIGLADSRFVNTAWLERVMGTVKWGHNGRGYHRTLKKDQEWTFWCDSQAFPDIRDVYEEFLRYDALQGDPSVNRGPVVKMAGDATLLNYKVGAPPPSLTPYTLILKIDPSVPGGTVNIDVDIERNEIRSAYIAINPQLSASRFASELPILFDEEDADAYALIPDYVTLATDRGTSTSYTAWDRYRLLWRYYMSPGDQVAGGILNRVDKKY